MVLDQQTANILLKEGDEAECHIEKYTNHISELTERLEQAEKTFDWTAIKIYFSLSDICKDYMQESVDNSTIIDESEETLEFQGNDPPGFGALFFRTGRYTNSEKADNIALQYMMLQGFVDGRTSEYSTESQMNILDAFKGISKAIKDKEKPYSYVRYLARILGEDTQKPYEGITQLIDQVELLKK